MNKKDKYIKYLEHRIEILLEENQRLIFKTLSLLPENYWRN